MSDSKSQISRPLGTSEHLWLKMGEIDSNNFVVIAQVEGCIDEDKLKAALESLCQAQEILRAKVGPHIKAHQFQVQSEFTPQLTILERLSDSHKIDFAEAELNSAISHENSSLWRLNWLRGESKSDFVLTFNHLLADGKSGILFFDYLFRKISSPGFKIPSTALLPPFEEQVFPKSSLLNSIKSFAKLSLKKLKPGKAEFTTLPRKPLEEQTKLKTKIITRQLKADKLEALIQNCRKNSCSLSSTIAATMKETFSESLFQDSEKNIGISFAVDTRPYTDTQSSQHIGYYVATADVTEKVSLYKGTWDRSREYKRTLTRKCSKKYFKYDDFLIRFLLRLKSKPSALLATLSKEVQNAAMLTNIGKVDIKTQHGSFTVSHCYHIPSVHLLGLPYLTLASSTVNGVLKMNFSYPSPLLTDQQVNTWASEITRRLEALASEVY